MGRIVDLSTDGLHVAVHRGFLIVTRDHEEVGRIALADIDGVMAHAHGLTWSNNALVKLADNAIPLTLCAANHSPVSCVWPLEGHHRQAVRMRAQANAAQPLKKRLWQQLVVAKIKMQGAVAGSLGLPTGPFDMLARKVRSGDPTNIEAQAARRYWPLLFGSSFRRDQNAGGANALLNYGYTVLRAATSRAICTAGLHPTFGLFHANQANAFALADDLMEPYRPLIDRAVKTLVTNGFEDVSSETKNQLASLTSFDLETDKGRSPVSLTLVRLAQSLATSLESGQPALDLPNPPSALELNGLFSKVSE